MEVTGSGEKSSLLLTVMLSVVSTTGPWWLLSCSLLAFLACFLKKPNMLRASSPTSGVSLASSWCSERGSRTRARPPDHPVTTPLFPVTTRARQEIQTRSLRRCIGLRGGEGGGSNVKTTSARWPILICRRVSAHFASVYTLVIFGLLCLSFLLHTSTRRLSFDQSGRLTAPQQSAAGCIRSKSQALLPMIDKGAFKLSLLAPLIYLFILLWWLGKIQSMRIYIV